MLTNHNSSLPAREQPHVTLSGAHFLQEDCPDDIVAVIENVLAWSQG
jgi:hypothetical protein